MFPNLKIKSDDDEPAILELKTFLEPKLAKFKIPKYWKILKEFPQTVSGKVQKFKLRDRTKSDFNL